MTHKLTTSAPKEVREVLDAFASLCSTYASDQRHMLRLNLTARARREHEVRAEVYEGLAEELRTTAIEEER